MTERMTDEAAREAEIRRSMALAHPNTIGAFLLRRLDEERERRRLAEDALRLLLQAVENVETMPPSGANPWGFYQDAKTHASAVLNRSV